SMNMNLSERMESKFFSGITKYLVPEWEDARYFKLSAETDDRSNKKMRLWQTSDKDDIEEILNKPKLWNEYFDEKKLKQLWEDARYFKLSAETDDRSNKKMRLWQTSDKDDIEEILHKPKLWNEYFDEKKLKQLWEDAKIDNLGIYTNAIEKLFYRVMMVSNF